VIVLGLSAFYHDSAAVLLINGEVLAAAQEERFSRIKHDNSFPLRAIKFVLDSQGLTIKNVDLVAYYERPWLKMHRLLSIFSDRAPKGFTNFIAAMKSQLDGKLFVGAVIRRELEYQGEIFWAKHHESHASSAFYPSPFESAAFLTVDGVGEWDTTTYGIGNQTYLEVHRCITFPDSLGMLYSAMTHFAGFKVNSGEYKLMGLAPYGEPKYVDTILDNLIEIKQDGSYRLNMEYFDYETGRTMINARFENLFERNRRTPETPITQSDMDIGSSIQRVLETIVLRMCKHIKNETEKKYLCLSGGVALNCVSNGKILREKIFDDIWIQPASGDAGGALGSALLGWYRSTQNQNKTAPLAPRVPVKTYYLGPGYSDSEIKEFLEAYKIPYTTPSNIEKETAKLLSEDNVVGWFQGGGEFGPRALGARSILGDPRSAQMQKVMNIKIKFRESFRPFAPVVMEECVSDWFDLDRASPYMLIVSDVARDKLVRQEDKNNEVRGLEKLNQVRSQIPAVTHVDNSARIQTVTSEQNLKLHNLLSEFKYLTGCPVLINTSFNVRGEPIVNTPEEAYQCFMRTNMDYLVLGNQLLSKAIQPEYKVDESWKEEFELD
jgi:carbamoyltransferase